MVFKNILLFIAISFSLLSPVLSFGQIDQNITIKGVVVSSDTNEAVPYVNIGLSESTIGTSSDHEGVFQLTLPKVTDSNTLVFSCINYKSKKISVDEVLSMDSIVILMVNDTLVLHDMVFQEKEVKPEDILIKAFNKPKDYGYTIDQYYKGKVIDSLGNVFYDMEAILQYSNILDVDGSISSMNCVIHKKNNLSSDKNGNANNSYFSNFMFYFNRSDARYYCNLGSEDCLSKLDMEFSNYAIYDGRLCYKIDYQFKELKKRVSRKKLQSIHGTLYIDPQEYDIIRWEVYGKFEQISNNKIIKYGKKGYPIKFTWIRNYRMINGKYYMSLIDSFQENKTINDKNEVNKIIYKHNNFSIDVKLENEETFIHPNPIDCEPYDINLVNYNESFWENFTAKNIKAK